MAAKRIQRHTLRNMQRAAAPRFELHPVYSHLTSLLPPQKCQKCKQPIRALSVRVGKIKPPVCYWYHVHCFVPPTTLLDVTQLGGADSLEREHSAELQQRLQAVEAERNDRRRPSNVLGGADKRKRCKTTE
jgi:hypothetical protein